MLRANVGSLSFCSTTLATTTVDASRSGFWSKHYQSFRTSQGPDWG